MRTTLDIADDVLLAVKERARRERRSAGEVLSDLARQALQAR
ncbi:MAG TPA: antitoxin, partial [Thermoanaerobaculia bacterium]|nr:antitoxin [Thermoanaerobaculia bacterium]